MTLTPKQTLLKQCQDEEGHQLYMYENPDGKLVFMQKRRGCADIYTTLAMRALYEKKMLREVRLADTIPIELKSGYETEATRVWII